MLFQTVKGMLCYFKLKVCSLTYQLILGCGVVGSPEGQDFKEDCDPKHFFFF